MQSVLMAPAMKPLKFMRGAAVIAVSPFTESLFTIQLFPS